MRWCEGKSIILGVTGGISAYRACDIIRGLTKEGASVNVIMTKAATEFITPLTLQTLSQNPVITELFNLIHESEIGHISLAKKADLMLIAPATANCIGKITHGIADDMLSTIFLATEAPVLLAPAMNEQMYRNMAVVENLEILKKRGVAIVDPEFGELACGDVGYGRLAKVDKIVEAVLCRLSPPFLAGKRVLITAGPTAEPLDPVREITNRSSGKMGFALAKAARRLGGDVTLVSGPVTLRDPWFVNTVRVRTAGEMREAVISRVKDTDLVIKAAAVADFKVREVEKEKIKKERFSGVLNLDENIDILEELGSMESRPYLVGFAAETEELAKNAGEKMERKNIDAIVANDVSREDIGFSSDYNQVTIFYREGESHALAKNDKETISFEILKSIGKRLEI